MLGTIRARLVTAGLGLDEAGRLRDEVDDLGEIVSALADGLAEAYERRALGPGCLARCAGFSPGGASGHAADGHAVAGAAAGAGPRSCPANARRSRRKR